MKITDYSRMSNYSIADEVERFGDERIRRLLICAIASGFQKQIKSKECMHALRIAQGIADRWPSGVVLINARQKCLNAVEATGENPHAYRRSVRVKARQICYMACQNYTTHKMVTDAILFAETVNKSHAHNTLNCLYQERRFMNTVPAEVKRMSSEIYAAKDFASMPILADAIEEFLPSEYQPMANHCRTQEHWPGCWVLDSFK